MKRDKILVSLNKLLLLSSLLFALLSASTLYCQKRMTREEYIEKYKDMAQEQMRAYRIPASIILAQGCLESGDGNSALARKAHNHFGIKCHDSWSGSVYHKDDDSINECFRKYDNVQESFQDHSEFLTNRSRYAFLFELELSDYKGWAAGLKRAGYATDSKYDQRLIKIIEDYGLYRFDICYPSTELLTKNGIEPLKHSHLYKYSLIRDLFKEDGAVYIIANDGDTYSMIAKEYHLFMREILRFNGVKSDMRLKSGTIVYLEKSKK